VSTRTTKRERRYAVLAVYSGTKPPAVVLETDSLEEAERFQIEHRRGRGLGESARASIVKDRQAERAR
jgi:hypothetical protein